ncbi:diacylglycerol kinase family protein [Brevibacterium sp. RIT 803]|uniref:diacylglycerol/lipid kinase family protein n=1 Tax=Brevibacterium sp. RIT 803 TaxID=2810210 RepID=UPI001950614E|nr:diacylglycerol kinase family protein [Brevibacterium sp. RIT 803]MBM6590061.1 NAD(+)/NADH kinase [Brevibacterium sp. RIT 803]
MTAPRLLPPRIRLSPEAAMKVGILANPKHARTTRAYVRLVEVLKRKRITYRSATTTPQWPGTEQTSQLLDWGADLVVVLGGDGTLRASAPVLAEARVPGLIIPTGTANVLSKHIGVRSAENALKLADVHVGSESMPVCHIPVNEADCFTATGSRREHFVSLAGVGGDAMAISGHARLPAALRLGVLGYAYGASRALFAPLIKTRLMDPHSASPQFDGTTVTEAWSVMAAKTSRPAGPIPVFDHAKVSADEFEFLAVELRSTQAGDRLGEWAQIGWNRLNRRRASHSSMHYWQGTELSIILETPTQVQLDGDLIGDCRRLDLRAGTTSLAVLTPN